MESIDKAIAEWKSRRRHMGCVGATHWFCSKVEGFKPKRLTRYTANCESFQHVVATDGVILIDLAPYADAPRDETEEDGLLMNKMFNSQPGMLLHKL